MDLRPRGLSVRIAQVNEPLMRDAKAKAWVRDDDVCDPATGNIGWDMTEPDNIGKTEDDLHNRDQKSYSNPKKNKGAVNKWRYTGICYADHVNAQ